MLCAYCDYTTTSPVLLSRHLEAEHDVSVGPGIARRDHSRADDQPIRATPSAS